MIMDKTNNEEELRKIELKLELIFERKNFRTQKVVENFD